MLHKRQRSGSSRVKAHSVTCDMPFSFCINRINNLGLTEESFHVSPVVQEHVKTSGETFTFVIYIFIFFIILRIWYLGILQV